MKRAHRLPPLLAGAAVGGAIGGLLGGSLWAGVGAPCGWPGEWIVPVLGYFLASGVVIGAALSLRPLRARPFLERVGLCIVLGAIVFAAADRALGRNPLAVPDLLCGAWVTLYACVPLAAMARFPRPRPGRRMDGIVNRAALAVLLLAPLLMAACAAQGRRPHRTSDSREADGNPPRVPSGQPPSLDAAATSLVLTGTLAIGMDQDAQPLADAPIIVACKRFYIHSGMGFDTPYALAPSLTSREGAFEVRFAPPGRGTVTSVELCVWSPGSVSAAEALLALRSREAMSAGVLPSVDCSGFARQLDWPPIAGDPQPARGGTRPVHLSIRVRGGESGASLAGSAHARWPSGRGGEALFCAWQLSRAIDPSKPDGGSQAAICLDSPLPEPQGGK